MINIKKYRAISGFTQEELAQQIGCSRTNIVYMESDECTSITKENEEKLCQLFNINLIQLYGNDNFKHFPYTDDEKIDLIMLLFKQIDNNSKNKVIDIIRGYK